MIFYPKILTPVFIKSSLQTRSKIEQITEQRIRKYEKKSGREVTFPIPLEQIVEQVLELKFDYDEIEERPGEKILGGLLPKERKILINEKHRALFDKKPGLERSTIGHEAGHWDIDIDRTILNYPTLFDSSTVPDCIYRHTQNSGTLAKILKLAAVNDKANKIYQKLVAGQDAPEVRSAVDKYQSALLMPKWLIIEAKKNLDFTSWKDLYELADLAQVTISNLTVRLKKLGLLYIPEGSKELYHSISEYNGQGELF